MHRFLLLSSIMLMLSGLIMICYNMISDNSIDSTLSINDSFVPLGKAFILDEEGNSKLSFQSSDEILLDDEFVPEALIPTFVDIDKSWAKANILFITEKGIMNGMTSDTFEPQGKVTRAMFITCIGKLQEDAIKEKEYEGLIYDDVKPSEYYYKYVFWARENGLLPDTFTSSENFKPNEIILREEIAYILTSYLEKIENRILIAGDNYSDENEISQYAILSINLLRGVGIMNGKTKEEFMPKGSMTRAEFATLLRRVIESKID